MSYNLFLLLNVNHEKEPLFDYISKKLEPFSPGYFCFDQSPDQFFSVEYLQEGLDSSLAIDIPFGAEEEVLREVFEFMTYLEPYVQFQVLDPQIGKLLEPPDDTRLVIERWKSANMEALASYRNGHYFLRNVEMRDGKKTMIEATRYQEETWQNHCSVALAYNRARDPQKAIDHFVRARALDPENAAILHALGVTYFNLKMFREAEDALTAYIQADPDNKMALQLLEECKSKQDQI